LFVKHLCHPERPFDGLRREIRERRLDPSLALGMTAGIWQQRAPI